VRPSGKIEVSRSSGDSGLLRAPGWGGRACPVSLTSTDEISAAGQMGVKSTPPFIGYRHESSVRAQFLPRLVIVGRQPQTFIVPQGVAITASGFYAI